MPIRCQLISPSWSLTIPPLLPSLPSPLQPLPPLHTNARLLRPHRHWLCSWAVLNSFLLERLYSHYSWPLAPQFSLTESFSSIWSHFAVTFSKTDFMKSHSLLIPASHSWSHVPILYSSPKMISFTSSLSLSHSHSPFISICADQHSSH